MWSIRGPDGTVATGWAVMPLRLFLGVTFLFAGLQKLANPDFFRSSSLFGIHAQLVSSAQSSPVHGLISHLVSIASAVGLVIALGEVAIGVGILAGLWIRVAAAAGMALSLGLFLTVSFHASPYFTGSDIVFFFAWTPVLLAGAGGAPALDTWLAERRSAAVAGAAVGAGAGPADEGGATGEGAVDGVPRRTLLTKGALTGLAAALVLIVSGLVAAIGRAFGGATTADAATSLTTLPPTTSTTATPTSTTGAGTATTQTTAQPSGTQVGVAAHVPVGGSAAFIDPDTGGPALVIQQPAGEFLAFDAICPHEGCTVAYAPSAKLIACPCHGSEFNARTGAVIRGPATTGLIPIPVIKGTNGDLYVPK